MTGSTELAAVMLMVSDAVLAAVSVAMASMVWAPSVTVGVSKLASYGAVVSTAMVDPSTRNSTWVTPLSSEASAVTVMMPENVKPHD